MEYEGRIPEALREHLEMVGVRVTGTRPLTLFAGVAAFTLFGL